MAAGADGQEIPSQIFGGQGEALGGAGQIHHSFCHA
jgi:hypothetical protein